MSPLLAAVIVVAVLAAALLRYALRGWVDARRIHAWAAERGLDVVALERSVGRPGPYDRGPSNRQAVFRVALHDGAGSVER